MTLGVWLAALALAIVTAWLLGPSLLARLIRYRLGGYVRDANVVDRGLPKKLQTRKRVVVIGAGVAGLTAAVTLCRRGFEVTLLESNDYIGGKLGSWRVQLTPTESVWVSHGFHAFFPHYHNLHAFLESVGARRDWARIGDYVIIDKHKGEVRFGAQNRTPVLNLLALARAKVFSLRDALAAPGRDLYGVFLEYDHGTTLDRYDHLSFARFVEVAKVPPRLKLAFDTFARAFFADADKLSMGELLKSFHFYYLGHDGGLLYDYPPCDYEPSILAPIRKELEEHGATIRLKTATKSLSHADGTFLIDGESFDAVVLATHVVSAREIVINAKGLPIDLRDRFAQLSAGQRYGVMRIWIDKAPRRDIPVFVITDRVQVLDAFAVYDRIERESAAWVEAHGGAVLELHCYAVPDEMDEPTLKQAMLDEMVHFFPELSGYSIRHEVWQLRGDFTAFHVGMHAARPTTDGVPGLVFAGDWVKLPFPAMLLEAACASGLLAANALLRREGLQEEPVRSVPLRGLMAGMRQPKARAVLTAKTIV